MNKHLSPLLLFIVITILILSIVPGCGDSTSSINNNDSLKADAFLGLKNTYAADYSRLTIIRGALYKFSVNPQNLQHLGTAIGAVEASIFPEDYELNRFDKLENISAEMRKEIISQPLLGITLKKREVLNHTYNAVLKPLSSHVEKNGPITADQTLVLNNLLNLLGTLSEQYSILAKKDVNFNGGEARGAFISIQNTLREMQKLELVKSESN